MTEQYIELHTRSAFSFLEGASSPDALIHECARLDIPSMALLDRNGVYGAPKFYLAGKRSRVTAHVGAEIALTDGSYCPLLVRDRVGYQNLCRLITLIKMRSPKGEGAATYQELAQHSGGLICLTGGEEGPLAIAFSSGRAQGLKQLRMLTEIFGRENVYAELQRHYDRFEECRNHAVMDSAKSVGLPLLATNGVCYAEPRHRELLDAFTCIKNHVRLTNAGRLLARNSERFIKDARTMTRLFADLPEAIRNTVELSSRLEFTMESLGYEFPHYPVPEGETEDSFLHKRTMDGARIRYTGRNGSPSFERALKQIEHELRIIKKLSLSGYFLIVWDIVNFCRDSEILVQGRGSAANSAVCYSLGITAVDPVGMELLFERFLSEQRGEWPDIDLDLPSGDRRERVIQYVYQRYGKMGAAMTANLITYRDRSAIREIGKVMGFDGSLLDRISKLTSRWEWKDPNDSSDRYFGEAGLDLQHPRIQKFLQLCAAVQDLPRHLGQHSGGMVISQGNLSSIVPLEPASMPGRVVVQWDKEDCADMGIIKVDLLGLGMMAVLEDSITLIKNHYGEEVDLARLPKDDTKVYAALQKADTVGMFQVESRAQMSCLPRLKPGKFYDIVVQIALIRPGPIVGNMVHPYLKRREGKESPECIHPALEPVLKRTLGVPLFQEQLLKMAMICSGFSGGEAEELRRAFGFKHPEAKMRDVEVKLRSGMEKNGITGKTQDEIVRAITSFAAYGFPESHAASFALIAYASAYLKIHYSAAFTAAILNNQPMGFYHPSTLIKDAQRRGLRVKPIDVTRSDWLCTIEGSGPEISVRIGLRYVRGLRALAGQAIVEERAKRPLAGIDDLRLRVLELNRAEMQKLAQVGALNFIAAPEGLQSTHRRGALWNVQRATRPAGPLFENLDSLVAQKPVEAHSSGNVIGAEDSSTSRDFDAEVRSTGLSRVFADGVRPDSLSNNGNAEVRSTGFTRVFADGGQPEALSSSNSAVTSPLNKMTRKERLDADLKGTGLTIGPHPVAYLRAEMDRLGVVPASELGGVANATPVTIGGAVICRQRPGSAKGFMFLSIEDETGIVNVIITPDLFDDSKIILLENHFLNIDGIVQNQGGVASLKATRIRPLKFAIQSMPSHDFR